MDPSVVGLRVLRAVAELGTFTAAAAELGYTQPAVSRQVAALERETGAVLFDRRPDGARLTPAGSTLLRHARVVLDELAAAQRELSGAAPGAGPVRLGVYVSAGADLLPTTLTALRSSHPEIRVTSREGTSPALVRAVRAGTLDVAVITSRPPHDPPDAELPRLVSTTLREGTLLVAVADPGPFAGRESVELEELADVEWIASPSAGADPMLGVWPGLPGRPRVAHTARDWLTKVQLVRAGCGVTTVPAGIPSSVLGGIRLVRVAGVPVVRRTVVVHLPQVGSEVAAVVRALFMAAG